MALNNLLTGIGTITRNDLQRRVTRGIDLGILGGVLKGTSMGTQRKPSLLIGLMNWLSLVSAIMEREIATRFAGGSLGHAWAVIIPVSWIVAITLFFRWMGRDAPIPVDLAVFMATGMVPYLIFRQIITSMMRTLKANRHLMTLGPATPEDLFTASAALEVMNAAVICSVIYMAIGFWTGFQPINDPLLAVWGLSLAIGLGIAIGRFAAVLSLLSDSAMRLVPIILRPFFWLSGIFFVAAELPSTVSGWLWFNPLFHAIEIMRSGYFAGFSSLFAMSSVPVICIIGLYFASRLIEGHIDQKTGRGMMPA